MKEPIRKLYAPEGFSFDGPLEALHARLPREWVIDKLIEVERDLIACGSLLMERRTPHLASEIGEQVEGLRAAKARLLAELGEPG